MKYNKISIETTTEAVDFISNLFDERGLEGIEIIDNIPLSEEEKNAMYIDILPELEPDDGSAVVNSYVSADINIDELKEAIAEGLKEIAMFVSVGKGKITIQETDDQDWINNWKAFFKPFRVADDIMIKPTWEPLDSVKENDIVVEIDPGTAFGTGSHETTKLCIMGLRKYITNQTKVLDIGCGSGILSIIGLKLGAKEVVGTDIDPVAIEATRENIQVNGIKEEQFTLLSGNIITDEAIQKEVGMETYDIVVANILADVIILLSGKIGKHLKKDGIFISSGIINNKKNEVQTALLENGFTIIETNQMGDWVSFVAKK